MKMPHEDLMTVLKGNPTTKTVNTRRARRWFLKHLDKKGMTNLRNAVRKVTDARLMNAVKPALRLKLAPA